MDEKLRYSWPILLTGTIAQHPEAQAIWIDSRERESQYLSVLSKMAAERNGVDMILFGENSSANLDAFIPLIDVYAKKRRKFQIYKVAMPDSEKFLGKGWGEGIIIKSSLENNEMLSCSSGFIKITGRYYVYNLKRVITIIKRGLKKNPNIKFICQSFSTAKHPEVETRFFWADTKFYRNNMLDVYKGVEDEQGVFFEHVIADRLLQLKEKFDFAVLPIPLIVQGVSGWNATLVMSGRTILKQEIMQKILPLPDLISFDTLCNL